MKYVINGKFLARPINGQCRVAIEIVKELDKIVQPDQFVIVAPNSNYNIEKLKNISIIRIGDHVGNGHVWEQTALFWYLLKNKSICINFLNTHPLFFTGYSYIHDVLLFAHPELYSASMYAVLQRIYNVIMQKSNVLLSKKIITVSNFSKEEIIKYLGINSSRIEVVYNGWQHMQSIDRDEQIFKKYPMLKNGNYFLAASGITPQKNFKWILENAKNNTDCLYVIIGEKVKTTQEEIINTSNVIFTGRITDSEMKALMSECKAFIHPAIYEGFGMTPLEAAACGCKKLIISNASCLPEIYGDYAYYIDPYDYRVNLEKLIGEERPNLDSLLNKYSWENAAKSIYKLIKD